MFNDNQKDGKEAREELEGNSVGSAGKGMQVQRKYRAIEKDGWNRFL